MVYDTEKILDTLINNISEINEVKSVGISGSKTPLPKVGEGDIDIFIYCDVIPNFKKRQYIINQLSDQLQEGKVNAFEGGHWEVGDFVLINGIETWLMYFTVNETLTDVESILNGKYHLAELGDTEDLERAVARKDVLFYHFALDISIDHFLQALFAINRTYFPSRKRTFDFIKNFNIKPEGCNEKLLEVVKFGSFSEGIDQSFMLWSNMIDELKKLDNI